MANDRGSDIWSNSFLQLSAGLLLLILGLSVLQSEVEIVYSWLLLSMGAILTLGALFRLKPPARSRKGSRKRR